MASDILAAYGLSKRTLMDEAQTQLTVKPGVRIVHTMGVYANGDRKNNGVLEEHLEEHIKYNLDMRPGRAFFVDGVCHNEGYLSKEQCQLIEQEWKDKPVIMTKQTVPYR